MSLPYNENVHNAVTQLLDHPKLTDGDRAVVNSISKFGQANGTIGDDYASTLGSIYKEVIHGGQYIHHDWWEDGNKEALMEYYVNAANWPDDLKKAKVMARICVNQWQYRNKTNEALRVIENATTVAKIQQYIINALLSGDGLAVTKW